MKNKFLKKYGNWRGDRTLSISFFLFFFLMFFLIGEQLVALPLYLVGAGTGESGPDKIHILDLALGDDLHAHFSIYCLVL